MNAEQRKLRNLVIILILLFLGLQGALWFSTTGVGKLQELDQRVVEQARENTGLVIKNQALEAEVNDLKDGLESVEERARSELGMIAQDETFFQLIDNENPEVITEDVKRPENKKQTKNP